MLSISTIFQKYEKHLSIAAFLCGFILDNLTLTRVDLWLDTLVLATYLSLAGAGIFFFHAVSQKRTQNALTERMRFLLTLLIPFAFGGLFSGYFVFYSRSASFVTSWLFILFVALLIIGNEFFKEKYARLEYQISTFFVTLFSFTMLYVPVIVHAMGTLMFIMSGFVSLLCIWFFVKALSFIVPEDIAGSKRIITGSVIGIYLVFNILYFTNIIPPIPLSLKDAGAYYFVERVSGGYRAHTDPLMWYEFYKKLYPTLSLREDESVYVYSSVFAPTDLETEIFHEWYYFDDVQDEWVETDRLSYSIVGGRDGGYRGYSKKSSVFAGKWRVDVVTKRGQIIGRMRFTIDTGEGQAGGRITVNLP